MRICLEVPRAEHGGKCEVVEVGDLGAAGAPGVVEAHGAPPDIVIAKAGIFPKEVMCVAWSSHARPLRTCCKSIIGDANMTWKFLAPMVDRQTGALLPSPCARAEARARPRTATRRPSLPSRPVQSDRPIDCPPMPAIPLASGLLRAESNRNDSLPSVDDEVAVPYLLPRSQNQTSGSFLFRTRLLRSLVDSLSESLATVRRPSPKPRGQHNRNKRLELLRRGKRS